MCSRELAGEVRRFSKGDSDSGRPCGNDINEGRMTP